jgi:hypothetical protein
MKSKVLPFILLFLTLVLGGCPSDPKFPDAKSRSAARQVVITMSFGVDLVTDVCIGIMRGIAEEDVPAAKKFGKECYSLIKPISNSIQIAAGAVDTWESDKDAVHKVACTAKLFTEFWPRVKELIEKHTAAPPELDDVVLFVRVLAEHAAPTCKWEGSK